MNEGNEMKEKDFRSLMNTMINHGATRDKLINEIDNSLDRLKLNRADLQGIDKKGVELPDVFVDAFKIKLIEMDEANERLALIVKRLNELI